MTFGSNFCRSNLHLKWKQVYLHNMGYRKDKLQFLVQIKHKDKNLQYPAVMSFIPTQFCKLQLDEILISNGLKNLLNKVQSPYL